MNKEEIEEGDGTRKRRRKSFQHLTKRNRNERRYYLSLVILKRKLQ